MRVTSETKKETQAKILEAAKRLFAEKGFAGTTTRDIASAADTATGTLFNYFPSKEALAMSLVHDAMKKGRSAYQRRRRGDESLTEDLFLFITTGLRHLKPYRHYIGPVLESAMSPFAKAAAGEAIRIDHLETVQERISAHKEGLIPTSMTINIYWSLYLGILASWSNDRSHKQEETLALIDYALRIFVQTLTNSVSGKEEIHGSKAK